jgi:catechol 2,3-dioxygenase-like lactoylglutathione lyase family enzyme
VSRVIGIDHCVIAVSDWNRSNAFYRDILGADLVERGNGFVYRFGDQFLSVHGPGIDAWYVAREPVRPGNSDLCFVWSGPIEEAVSHLALHGVDVEAGPVEAVGPLGRRGRHVYFRDPDGSLLEFVSYA